jgi:hypothetical protein
MTLEAQSAGYASPHRPDPRSTLALADDNKARSVVSRPQPQRRPPIRSLRITTDSLISHHSTAHGPRRASRRIRLRRLLVVDVSKEERRDVCQLRCGVYGLRQISVWERRPAGPSPNGLRC